MKSSLPTSSNARCWLPTVSGLRGMHQACTFAGPERLLKSWPPQNLVKARSKSSDSLTYPQTLQRTRPKPCIAHNKNMSIAFIPLPLVLLDQKKRCVIWILLLKQFIPSFSNSQVIPIDAYKLECRMKMNENCYKLHTDKCEKKSSIMVQVWICAKKDIREGKLFPIFIA